MNRPSISLIVSTYNWPEALNLSLLSIKRQSLQPMEVIIADDGSALETQRLIESLQPIFPFPLIHVWHKDLGFRKSIILNTAVRAASGSYIVQIDGDVIINKNFINDHSSLAEKGVFVRGTRAHIAKDILPMVYKTQKTDFTFLSKGIINRFNALRLPCLSFLLQRKSNDSRSVRGSNLAYWKSDYVMVNGYNNQLQGWGHEDEELAARFVNNEILKKTVKLKAVQFHLYHKEASRSQELLHTNILEVTRREKLKTCASGFAQAVTLTK